MSAPILRLLVCGSVDDGKSTLIGRLLHDTGQIPDDQVEALTRDSTRDLAVDCGFDLALLTDGLSAEREQGITIDVAWRVLATPERRILIADTPGHVQHTRNMATGASGCEAAVVLVDVERGVLPQTRRHVAIVALMGLRHVVFAVNKLDLVGFSTERFEDVAADCRELAAQLGLRPEQVDVIPVAARDGDNVTRHSTRLSWWTGPTLLEALQVLDVEAGGSLNRPLRFAVQLVLRPDATFRGYAGTVASGSLAVGDEVQVLPSGIETRIARIVTFDGDLQAADAGAAIAVTLEDDIDVVRGDLIVHAARDERPPLQTKTLGAALVWLDQSPYRDSQSLLLRSNTGTTAVRIRRVIDAVDMETLERRSAQGLRQNDVVTVEIDADRDVVCDPYLDDPATGAFVLVERVSQRVVAAGMVRGRPSPWDQELQASLAEQSSDIGIDERHVRHGHLPATIVVMGMSGTGKSTFARALERRLFDVGAVVVRMDGEDLRRGISRGLGFSADERSEHLRRAAETARMLNDHGQLVVLAVEAPAREVRVRMAETIGEHRYFEVYLEAPEDVRRSRDPSGLYVAAERGLLGDLPGVTADYEPPEQPDVSFDTSVTNLAASVEKVLNILQSRGVLPLQMPGAES